MICEACKDHGMCVSWPYCDEAAPGSGKGRGSKYMKQIEIGFAFGLSPLFAKASIGLSGAVHVDAKPGNDHDDMGVCKP